MKIAVIPEQKRKVFGLPKELLTHHRITGRFRNLYMSFL
jgi:hypothetical protein